MLGTSNAMCTRSYNTCFYLRVNDGDESYRGMMVDAGGGNGIFRQLYKARIPYEDIRYLMVTHCHTDHIMGVVWLIRKMSPLAHKGRLKAPLTIYCHDEVKHALLTMCELMLPAKIRSGFGTSIIFREVVDGETIDIEGMTVTFFDIASTKAKQFGFSAVLPDGQRVVCMGDEPYDSRNEQYAEGADWLLHEAFCLWDDRAAFRPEEKHHSTVRDTAMLAQQLEVKNLVLYHGEDTNLAMRKANYTAEARRYFSGNVYVPNDLEVIDLANDG